MSVITTYTGIHFDILQPGESTLSIIDIAHSLSQLCRFTGHTREFYSVAEHCLWASVIAAPEHKLAALLHDASEAYVGDMSRPLKHMYEQSGYRVIENEIERAIFAKYGVAYPYPPEIKEIDDRLAMTEAAQLFQKVPSWATNPYDITLECFSPKVAKIQYIERFYALASRRKAWAA